MEARTRSAFLALVLVQAAHSIEEYVSGLHEVFAPARFVSGLVGGDADLGFIILNAAVLAFGAWCYFARVRPGHASAAAWMRPWVLVELVNGAVHSTMVVVRGGYFPGAVTAPILFALALFLAARLLRSDKRRAVPVDE